ncbi:MAG: hypothetical protein HC901_03150, partial [Bdellovibrionaceae bacterium]|nr:hypothetical protein [Pseudobdellovibrionaceae bacterium]
GLGTAADGSLWGRGFLRQTVVLPAPVETFYGRHGDWPGPLSLAVALVAAWRERRAKAACPGRGGG